MARGSRWMVVGALGVGLVGLAQARSASNPWTELEEAVSGVHAQVEGGDCLETEIGGISSLISISTAEANLNLGSISTAADGALAVADSLDESIDVLGEAVDQLLGECDVAYISCTNGAMRVEANGWATVYPCGVYECDGDSCGTSCGDDEDCAGSATCIDGECATPPANVCTDDGLSVVAGDGEERSCWPYRCAGGQCITSCAVTSDCIPGRVCDTDPAEPNWRRCIQ